MAPRAKKGRASFGHAKMGTGARFDKCVASVSHRKGTRDAKAVCASIGRKAYGKSQYQKLAAAGRRRHH